MPAMSNGFETVAEGPGSCMASSSSSGVPCAVIRMTRQPGACRGRAQQPEIVRIGQPHVEQRRRTVSDAVQRRQRFPRAPRLDHVRSPRFRGLRAAPSESAARRQQPERRHGGKFPQRTGNIPRDPALRPGTRLATSITPHSLLMPTHIVRAGRPSSPTDRRRHRLAGAAGRSPSFSLDLEAAVRHRRSPRSTAIVVLLGLFVRTPRVRPVGGARRHPADDAGAWLSPAGGV